MHSNLIKIFYFINKFIEDDINKLNKNISIIYRNYNININNDLIKKIRDFCKINKRKFYISYYYNLAFKLNLDGIYIPAFDKSQIISRLARKKKFEILGSAHNLKEIKIKEKQGCTTNILANNTNRKIIALGGLNFNNLKKISLTKSVGFASISLFKKNGLNKFRPFLNNLSNN